MSSYLACSVHGARFEVCTAVLLWFQVHVICVTLSRCGHRNTVASISSAEWSISSFPSLSSLC